MAAEPDFTLIAEFIALQEKIEDQVEQVRIALMGFVTGARTYSSPELRDLHVRLTERVLLDALAALRGD
jgi:hypothetical protein